MTMNDPELKHVVEDLQSLVSTPILAAFQPSRDRVVLAFAGTHLLLVPRGPWSRLHSLNSRPKNPPQPYSFQGAMRAHLHGPLTALVKHSDDRIVDLWFGERRLHARFTGRSGGLWLLDGDRVIAAFDGPAPTSLPAISTAPARVMRPRFEPSPGIGWAAAAERYFSAAESRGGIVDRRVAVTRGLQRTLTRVQRLAEALRTDLENAAEAPRWRRMGDALAANLHLVKRGAVIAHVEDLEDPEIFHAIPLDPNKPASAALERLYSKARRLDRSGDQVIEHLDEVEHRITALQQGLADVAEATDERLTELERLVPRSPGSGRGEGVLSPWHEWTGPAGERILVGRNELGNRKLVFNRSKGSDWWMHVRDRPAAHIVIPYPKERSPPLDLLLCAAQIALVHAKVPDGVAMDVQYTRIRNVRPIPGEASGRVVVHEEKVLRVVRDAAVLRGWVKDDGPG